MESEHIHQQNNINQENMNLNNMNQNNMNLNNMNLNNMNQNNMNDHNSFSHMNENEIHDIFNPMYVIGKPLHEALPYFRRYNIQYVFDNCTIKVGHLAIHRSYPEGTHICKIYDYNIRHKEVHSIITHFEGVTGKPLFIVNGVNIPTISIF